MLWALYWTDFIVKIMVIITDPCSSAHSKTTLACSSEKRDSDSKKFHGCEYKMSRTCKKLPQQQRCTGCYTQHSWGSPTGWSSSCGSGSVRTGPAPAGWRLGPRTPPWRTRTKVPEGSRGLESRHSSVTAADCVALIARAASHRYRPSPSVAALTDASRDWTDYRNTECT